MPISHRDKDYKTISKSKYFDKKWYLNMYPDVKRAGINPVRHYMQYGWREGRNPSPKFDTNGYLKRYQDCHINPLLHYEQFGHKHNYTTGSYIDENVSIQYWAKHDAIKNINCVIYSCISGGYDEIITDFYPDAHFDYVLFTDNAKLLKKKRFLWWQIKPLAFSKTDNVRNARWHKTHPHILFPEYKYSVWMDSNIQISGPAIYKLINKHIRANHKIAISLHPHRDCIYDEAAACIADGKDNPDLINTQMQILRADKYPEHNGLYETNVLLRRHNDAKIKKLCEQWWDFIKNYSRRDQLSFNYLLWKNGIRHYPVDKISLRFHPEFKLVFHNYKPSVTEYKINKILVHLHLFYHDQLDWFLHRLKNITRDYDLYVTVTEHVASTEYKLKQFKPDVHILHVPNRGYDIYPFWLVLQQVSLADYIFVLKMHTKNARATPWIKNGIIYNGWQWHDDLINPLIGSRHQFERLSRLIKRKGVGMVGSGNLIGDTEKTSQAKNTEQLCQKMGVKYFATCPFVCGTMFAVRSDLLMPFQQYPFKESDFSADSKTGSVGTVAHSLETVFGLLVAGHGLKIAKIHNFTTWRKHANVRANQLFIKLFKHKKNYSSNLEYIKHSRYFNRRWYLRMYPDVAQMDINPAQHYLDSGWRVGYNPSPKFDTGLYLYNNPDVARAGVNPLLHYEKYGKYENRFTGMHKSLRPTYVKEYYDVARLKGERLCKITNPVVVSVTSYPARIDSVYQTIQTLKNQSVKPDKIILYLSRAEFPKKRPSLPRNLTDLLDDTFEIHWIDKTLRSFQKIIPALREFPDAILVTADDDILYTENWLKLLLAAYSECPNIIHCHRAHRIVFNKGKIAPYNAWKMSFKNESAVYNNFLTGVGGVLYPPHCLDKNILNESEFLELCPMADDIWIWAMAVKNHTKIHIINNSFSALNFVPGSQDGQCLWKTNTVEKCYNDEQLQNVLTRYPEVFYEVRRERLGNILLAYLLFPYYLFACKYMRNKIKKQQQVKS